MKEFNHDQMFKRLIKTFFKEFIELFIPEAANKIDLTHLKFLDKELYTDIISGEKHLLDLVVETKLKGKDSLILVHIEPQSYAQKDFAKRMFKYFSLLHHKFDKPIFPIALFTYRKKRTEKDLYQIEFPFFKVLDFHFFKIELGKMDYRQFINSDNPVAAALMTRMGYSKEERLQVRREILRIFLTLQISDAKKVLIDRFVSIYLPLNKQELERFKKEEVSKMPPRIRELSYPYVNEWEEMGVKRGIKKGIRQGIREGIREGRKEGRKEGEAILFIKLLENKFGKLSKEIKNRIKKASPKQIETWGIKFLSAKSLEGIGID